MDSIVTHGGRMVDYEVMARKSREDITDFSANINPYAPPETVTTAILQNIYKIQDYPDPISRRLRQTFSERYGVSKDCVFAANGASEVIDLFLRVLRPKRVVLLEPSFSEYAHAAKRNLIPIKKIAMASDFCLPIYSIKDTLRKGDLLVINTPHNPSGRFYSRSELEVIYELILQCGAYAMIDEAFIDFVDGGEEHSSLPLVHSHIVVVRSLTKMYGIAGLRLGFGVADQKIVDHIVQMRDGWSVNLLAEEAGIAALQDHSFAAKTREWLREERNDCMKQLEKINGVIVYPSSANFLLVDGSLGGLHVAKWQQRLTQIGFFVRNCASYGTFTQSVFRMAILHHHKNALLVDELASELSN